jgi:hypothetical protein
VRGSKRGGHIELVPALPGKEIRQLILGEGVETVLSVWHALVACGIDVRFTAFWSGIDLGNLAGKAKDKVTHPTLKTPQGRAVQVPGFEPDLSEPAIVIPDTVIDLVLLMDGDSEFLLTACAMHRATRRYAAPGRTVRTAEADHGEDFNSMLSGHA